MLPDLGEFLGLGVGELAELLHHAVGHALADRREHVALLDQLARDIERQIGAVDHEAHETQPAGQDVGVLGDQHAAHIKLVAPFARRIEQIERARAGNEGEDSIFVAALGAPVEGQSGLVELAGKAPIKFGVFLGRHLGFGVGPDRRAVADAALFGAEFLDEVDRHRDRAGMVADDALERPGLEEFLRGVDEVKRHAGPALRRVFERERRDGERAFAVRRPAPRLLSPGAARVDGHFVRDHERRIEADAELAYEGGGFLARVLGRELVEEGLGAGAGDGAKPLGQVFAGHADAVVREGQGLGVGIDRDLDRERSAILDQFGPGDQFVAQLLAGVGGVGDELADENLAVGIDRMDHEIQQARNVGLEALRAHGFAGRGLGVGGQG